MGLVSAGGTGSYQISADVPGISELQAGGGCFMDQLYSEDCHVDGLEFALTVRTTVASIPSADTVTVDAGWKAMPADRHQPLPIRPKGLTLRSLSAEHGVVVRGDGAPTLDVGDTIDFLPGYHDADRLSPRRDLRHQEQPRRGGVPRIGAWRLQLGDVAQTDLMQVGMPRSSTYVWTTHSSSCELSRATAG